MSFDPTSIVTLIENCVKLKKYVSDVKNSSTQRGRLIEEVGLLQRELEALQKLANAPAIAGNQASLERLAQLLDPSEPFLDLVDKTLSRVKEVLSSGTTSDPKANRLRVLGKRGVAVLGWTSDKAEVKDLLLDLERYKSQIALVLHQDMLKQQERITEALQDVGDNLNQERRLKIAEFISPHDYTSGRKQLLEQKLSGTGNWMLHHPDFVAWRDDKQSPRMLWGYGHPGAGKSIMAALIIEHLQSTPGNIVLSVFCQYSSQNFSNLSVVLSGLLRQLIEKTAEVPRAIRDLYLNHTHPTLDTLLDFLAEMVASHAQPIYIVLDALDECPSEFRLDLLHALQNLDSDSSRVLITSRPPALPEPPEHPSIRIRASKEDILLAVDTTLSKLRHTWLDELKDKIREQVVEKSDGMFLLAKLQLLELQRDATCPRDVKAILNSLPRTLDAAYQSSFQRIRDQGKRTNKLTCRALALIALGSNDFDLEDVQHLIAKGRKDRQADLLFILQCCQGLIHVDYTEHPVFIHSSVYEYTIRHWSELFPEHPSRMALCIELGYLVLTGASKKSTTLRPDCYWHCIVSRVTEPDELKRVVSLLSTPAARASLLEYDTGLAPFLHDPLQIASYFHYNLVRRYITDTELPDAERLKEADHAWACGNESRWELEECNKLRYIDERYIDQGYIPANSHEDDSDDPSEDEDEDEEEEEDEDVLAEGPMWFMTRYPDDVKGLSSSDEYEDDEA